ncbi:hypothetical protein D3C85_1534980 [compost metagenome]
MADATRVVGFGAGRITFDGEPRTFFYGKEGEASSPCVELGFDPPFVIQTAMNLLEQGIELEPLPLHMEELAEAISCR